MGEKTYTLAARGADTLAVVAIDYHAPVYSPERLAYFNGLMDRYARLGDKCLTFTPPSRRGSLLTRAEAWAINVQRSVVPTLVDAGRWRVVEHGAHPSVLSSEQAQWLSDRWGECASAWATHGWDPEQHARDMELLARHPAMKVPEAYTREARSKGYDVAKAALLADGATEAGAQWLWELDVGPLDESRRHPDFPSWPPTPHWRELRQETRDAYRRRAAGVLAAAVKSIGSMETAR